MRTYTITPQLGDASRRNYKAMARIKLERSLRELTYWVQNGHAIRASVSDAAYRCFSEGADPHADLIKASEAWIEKWYAG